MAPRRCLSLVLLFRTAASMRGLSTLYCLACEREGCLVNSHFLEVCRVLDTSEECPTEFDFRGNYLGDAGAAAIVRTVAIMRWVRFIDLRDSGAGAKTVEALVAVADEHPSLRCVDLRGGGNEVFAMSGRRLLAALGRCTRLVVHVNYDDLPATMARKLQAVKQRNEQLQREEEAAMEAEKRAVMPVLDSLQGKGHEEDLFYLATHDSDGNSLYSEDPNLLHLVDSLNTYMEDYLESYQYVGRVAALLAVDLGAAILPCIRATAVAVPPSVATSTGRVYPLDVVATIRAVDALLGGLRANPFLLEELIETRGPIFEMYLNKLRETRGEHESLVTSRLGLCPSYQEKMLVVEMRTLYNRIVAGIVQKSMVDLPSMCHVEEHLRRVRVEVINRLLEGRERVLPVLMAQVQYFGYNHAKQTTRWAEAYATKKEEPPQKSERMEGSDEEDEEEPDAVADSSPVTPKRGANMCVEAIFELRELLQDNYTSLRYAVTRPLFEALPMEIRMFLSDLALRRAASLYTPNIFVLERKEKAQPPGQCAEGWPLTTKVDDPFDIVRIFERVRSRQDLSEVLCAFEEWYRLRQVECYDVTYVSRQELLSRTRRM
ncbi:hypothetical protein TcCL_NonESM05524 [Trypanosoma cruzi]|uniref:Uncharacterized protein n=2 Tax=Trypanosoma cruzi TaxID=5693 RepID=Q4DU73_TRYCC|nr:hypothetical protein, conserved [Trypanosoma cruzi]EAN96086.1 hypothetical protein, conserved [Trypanosoma cruzi]RNC44774.1 hypothetical protein TcCL_NonESM05524 [Trypanosoma cruzi]|eukprot:XP_817937.1 hypothetical protein [Trypanosoma cruzi strain CL Brener]